MMDLSTSKQAGATEGHSKKAENKTVRTKKEFNSPVTSPMLPPESWDFIFKNLPFSDLSTVINTCPEWRQLLLEKRKSFLLPQVLEILVEYISTSDILRLRKVSKHFKTTVDGVLQQFSVSPLKAIDRSDPDTHNSKRKINNVSTKIYRVEEASFLCSLQAYQKLNSEFPNSEQGNPFLAGLLMIEGDWIDEPGSMEKICSIVTRFGCNISSFHFEGIFNEVTIPTLFAVLDGKLPNLKTLILDGMVEQLCLELFRNCPDSKLRNLEYLDLENFSIDLSAPKNVASLPFINLFRCYGPHLTVLRVDERAFEFYEINADFLSTNLKNLQCLNIELRSYKVLEKLRSATFPNLQRLEICGDSCDIKFVDVLNLINKFVAQLTYLGLNSYDIKLGRLDPRLMPVLPKLKKLRAPLTLRNHAWLSNFLKVCCQNLEEIEFTLEKEEITAAKKAFEFVPKLRRIVAFVDYKNEKYVFRRR